MKAACIRLCCVLASVFFILPLFSITKEKKLNKTPISKSSNIIPYSEYQHGENNASSEGNQYTRKRVDINSTAPKQRRYETTRRTVETRDLVRTPIGTPLEYTSLEKNDIDTVVQTQILYKTMRVNHVVDTLLVDSKQETTVTLPISLFMQKHID